MVDKHERTAVVRLQFEQIAQRYTGDSNEDIRSRRGHSCVFTLEVVVSN
jgi:hypothetical protein